MSPSDPTFPTRRSARAETERRATAAIPIPEPEPGRRRSTFEQPAPEVGRLARDKHVAEELPGKRGAEQTPTADPPSRRALRERPRATLGAPLLRRRLAVAVAGVVVVAACAIAVGVAASGGGQDAAGPANAAGPDAVASVQGPPAVPDEGLPVPTLAAAPAAATPCDNPAFTAALAAKDDGAAIAAAGGGAAFRDAVASGIAPCVSLNDPTHQWVVVNKQRPYDPIDWRPDDLVMPDGVRALEQSAMRSSAAKALTTLVRAADDAGAGEIGYLSAFRSYATQQETYAGRVAVGGVAAADRESARAGFSEHQSGLAVDIVPCSGSCGSLDDVAGSSQGAWVREHAWEYGFVIRYVDGQESVSGYEPEAWHLRYIGPELAQAYHDGGYTTLEAFFNLPAAPSY